MFKCTPLLIYNHKTDICRICLYILPLGLCMHFNILLSPNNLLLTPKNIFFIYYTSSSHMTQYLYNN